MNTNKKVQADVIFSYTDEHAVQDGVLVAVSRHDRITRHLFDFLAELKEVQK